MIVFENEMIVFENNQKTKQKTLNVSGNLKAQKYFNARTRGNLCLLYRR